MEEVVISKMTSKDRSYKIGGLILGAFLIYSFTTDMNWGKLFMGFIFIIISGYYKQLIVVKDGLEFTYNYFWIKKHKSIKFNDLDEIILILEGKNHLAYFRKGQSSERLSLPPDKMDEMAKFIRENSNVKIRVENLLDK